MAINKLSTLKTTECREWFNNFLEKASPFYRHSSVLDVGKSIHWDYSPLFEYYTTIDTNEDVKPDIVGNICDYDFGYKFDFIICQGMYESVDSGRQQDMINNIYKHLVDGGMAIFGFIGKDYEFHGNDNGDRFDGDFSMFGKFKVRSHRNINNKYHYILVEKCADSLRPRKRKKQIIYPDADQMMSES